MLFKITHTSISKKVITIVAAVAGLSYNFWLVGYIVDPQALHNAYVSILETPNRPYNWLFISMDVVTSVLAILISWFLITRNKNSRNVYIFYLTFAVTTLLDAVIPITAKCSSSISACSIDLSQVFNFHAITSLVAFFSIFGSLLVCRRKASIIKIKHDKVKWLNILLFAWCSSGVFMVLTIVIDKLTMLSQGLFLGTIGLSLFVIPLVTMTANFDD